MRLWLLRRADGFEAGWDEHNGFVIRSSCEADARAHASGAAENDPPRVWLDPAKTTCIELTLDGDAGVIIGSFNAG